MWWQRALGGISRPAPLRIRSLGGSEKVWSQGRLADVCLADARTFLTRGVLRFGTGGLLPSGSAACSGLRMMSYYSGSHYEMTHMIGAKNPDLPKDEKLAQAAVKIFGTAATSNPHQRSIRKLLMKPLKGPVVADYYPEELRHNKHGFKDPRRVRQEEKLVRLKRNGKNPPKKGEGKRAKKKK